MRAYILSQVESLSILRSPPPLRRNESRSNSRDRCIFHNDEGHENKNYSYLKDAIEEPVRDGELKDFVAQGAMPSGQSSQGTGRGKKKATSTRKVESRISDEDEDLMCDEEGNDPMVVEVIIARFEVKRISVHSGNAVEVLTWDAY
ncbi:hypothetical protein PVK06_035381 [Gossypium arboreum]|uniref:Uncharacterized protein n=1 Tax=Gossypium arboreum TaxID=29729 RepID=A0ABR0NGN5_GOSAR|nr:hypothetical protein PVK06_035381 [Gossypium arboreum]